MTDSELIEGTVGIQREYIGGTDLVGYSWNAIFVSDNKVRATFRSLAPSLDRLRCAKEARATLEWLSLLRHVRGEIK